MVFQIGFLITGIPGINYFFIIGQAIWITLAFLFFEGKRWRLLLSITIFGLLTMPTSAMGAPFNILPRIPLIVNAFQSDLIMNSLYPLFRKRGKMTWLITFFVVEHFIIGGLLRIITYPLFFTSEYVAIFTGIFTMMLPVIIAESISGGYISYFIYLRLKKMDKNTNWFN